MDLRGGSRGEVGQILIGEVGGMPRFFAHVGVFFWFFFCVVFLFVFLSFWGAIWGRFGAIFGGKIGSTCDFVIFDFY